MKDDDLFAITVFFVIVAAFICVLALNYYSAPVEPVPAQKMRVIK